MIYSDIEDLIGNTPLLKIDGAKIGIKYTDIYVKLEYLNPFGSVKDRTAKGLLSRAKRKELWEAGKTVIESSSGNTAKALQLLAGRQNIPFTTVTNRIKVPEIEQQLRYLGTKVIALPGRSECPDPSDENNAINVIERMMNDEPDKFFHTSQYTNPGNPRIHEQTTAHELWDDLGTIDIISIGVGTGGSSGGMIEYAKSHQKTTKFIGIVAHPSDFLPGIRTYNELFETELFTKENFAEMIEVSSVGALTALRNLVVGEGVLAGPTTGANMAGLLEYLKENDRLRLDGNRQTAVLLACDRLEPYMSYIRARQPELFGESSRSDIFAAEHNDIDPAEIEKEADETTRQWTTDENVLVIDTRGVKPYSHFHIENSLNFPEEHLREVLPGGSPFPPNKTLLFVCPRGDRSRLLAGVMTARGYQSFSLKGGLLAWRSNGLPFVRGEV